MLLVGFQSWVCSPSLFNDAGEPRCGLEFEEVVDRDAGAAPRVEDHVLLDSVRQPLVDLCWRYIPACAGPTLAGGRSS